MQLYDIFVLSYSTNSAQLVINLQDNENDVDSGINKPVKDLKPKLKQKNMQIKSLKLNALVRLLL